MRFHLRVPQSTLIPHYIDFITSFVQYWYHLRLIRLYCCIVVFVVSYTLYSYCSHWIILMFVFSSYSSSPHPVQFVHFHIAPSSSSTISKLVYQFFLVFSSFLLLHLPVRCVCKTQFTFGAKKHYSSTPLRRGFAGILEGISQSIETISHKPQT